MSCPESGLLGEKNKNKYIPLASGWNKYSHILSNGKTHYIQYGNRLKYSVTTLNVVCSVY
jgi:hypothetical protein